MRFKIHREVLIKPLQLVSAIADRKQDRPILANVLFTLKGNQLTLVSSDTELELHASLSMVDNVPEAGFTLPAKKLLGICKSLPDDSVIELHLEESRATLRAGKSRFLLSVLPADEFPCIRTSPGEVELTVDPLSLKQLIDNTQFAMASQDVRYYLNGLLLKKEDNKLIAVATDGHRLAYAENELTNDSQQSFSLIIPKKGVTELSRLLAENPSHLTLCVDNKYLTAKADTFTLTTKLVEGRFPDYTRVFPSNTNNYAVVEREMLKHSISRASILSNEKTRGVRLEFAQGVVRISANNPEQEEAEDEFSIDFQGQDTEIGFNASYLLDILNVVPPGAVTFSFLDSKSSTLIESTEGSSRCRYVVMPLQI